MYPRLIHSSYWFQTWSICPTVLVTLSHIIVDLQKKNYEVKVCHFCDAAKSEKSLKKSFLFKCI